MMFSATDHHMLQCPSRPFPSLDKSWKSNGGAEIAPSCPRCASPNTKFCYYNNYSLSQPRYFCKGCRRYWTKGGSLRNVPVGGGCRKSRRAKAVRVPQLERGSGNYNYSSDASPGGDSVGGAGEGSPGRTSGGEIDLAVVFAKFLNHDSGFGPEFGGSAMSDQTDIAAGNVSGALSSDVLQEEMAMDLMGELQLLEEGYTQLCDGGETEIQEKRIQELIGHDDTNAYGLPTLLSDEAAAQDILWSDDPQTLQNFTWQPVMQLQEFEPVLSNDHPKISANLIGEFWNSFDLSAHEIFSRP